MMTISLNELRTQNTPVMTLTLTKADLQSWATVFIPEATFEPGGVFDFKVHLNKPQWNRYDDSRIAYVGSWAGLRPVGDPTLIPFLFRDPIHALEWQEVDLAHVTLEDAPLIVYACKTSLSSKYSWFAATYRTIPVVAAPVVSVQPPNAFALYAFAALFKSLSPKDQTTFGTALAKASPLLEVAENSVEETSKVSCLTDALDQASMRILRAAPFAALAEMVQNPSLTSGAAISRGLVTVSFEEAELARLGDGTVIRGTTPVVAHIDEPGFQPEPMNTTARGLTSVTTPVDEIGLIPSAEEAEDPPTKLLLGAFRYHDATVTLTVTDDEKVYEVRSLGHIKAHKDTFDELGKARQHFQDLCDEVMRKTSRSDVLIYMQQQAQDVPVTLEEITKLVADDEPE